RLNGVGGNRSGKHFVSLVGHGLTIDDIAYLRVIAQRVKQSVRVRGNAGGRQNDRIVQSGIRRQGWQRGKEMAIDGITARGPVFDEVAGVSLNCDTRLL